MKILIIEDDATQMKLVHVVLAHAGHIVSEAAEAEEALRAIKDNKPTLIMMDLSLPGIDGIALTRRLKKDPATREIPIIALTAYPDRFSRTEALEAGCAAYIVKPIDTRILPKQIADMTPKKKQKSKKK